MSATVVAVRLDELESVIERGMRTFVEVGQALAEIRDSKLYLNSHDTFEDYARERWDFSRTRSYELMNAAEVVSAIADTTVPRNEAVARELVPLREQPTQLREVWTQAVEQHGPTPTAKQVHEVVASVRPEPSRPEPELTYCPTCGHRLRVDQPRPPRSTK